MSSTPKTSEFQNNPKPGSHIESYSTLSESKDLWDCSHPKKPSSVKRRLKEAEAEGVYLWHIVKHYVSWPFIRGGLFGFINVGLLAGIAYTIYTRPQLCRDRKLVSSTIAATLSIIFIEYTFAV